MLCTPYQPKVFWQPLAGLGGFHRFDFPLGNPWLVHKFNIPAKTAAPAMIANRHQRCAGRGVMEANFAKTWHLWSLRPSCNPHAPLMPSFCKIGFHDTPVLVHKSNVQMCGIHPVKSTHKEASPLVSAPPPPPRPPYCPP